MGTKNRVEVEKTADAIRKAYYKEWRAKNQDKVKKHISNYWRKKAEEKLFMEKNDADKGKE